MNEKKTDYIKLGCFLVLSIVLWVLFLYAAQNSSRLTPEYYMYIRLASVLAIPALLTLKIVAYYSVQRQSIIALAVFNMCIFFSLIDHKITIAYLILIASIVAFYLLCYFYIKRKERATDDE